jgi:hypothetical protein
MRAIFTLKRRWVLLLYAALDVICIGAGMGGALLLHPDRPAGGMVIGWP